MFNIYEIVRGLRGAVQIAKFDRSANQYFENTSDAFWSSFQAAIIALPAYAALQLLAFYNSPSDIDTGRIVLIEISTYVIGWVFFPLIMVSLTEFLGRFDKYFQFIVAWNWAIVLQLCLYLLTVLLAISGNVPNNLIPLLSLFVITAILIYQGFIVILILDVSAQTASIIVLIDFVFALFLSYLARGLEAG
mgnify:CR=1 FL=1